jgi:glucose-1-phosphate cytidylyltransferase
MKTVILTGGLGTRLAEETELREIGGKPILWHIMKGYAHFGITDFVISLGYRAIG